MKSPFKHGHLIKTVVMKSVASPCDHI